MSAVQYLQNKMKKIYVSLPITGNVLQDQKNHAFVVSVDLAQKDWDVVTPFDVVLDPLTPYNQAMGKCIEALLECDAIYMCKNWQSSHGCRAELQTAIIYEKEVVTE